MVRQGKAFELRPELLQHLFQSFDPCALRLRARSSSVVVAPLQLRGSLCPMKQFADPFFADYEAPPML